jgi:hypothetical protein
MLASVSEPFGLEVGTSTQKGEASSEHSSILYKNETQMCYETKRHYYIPVEIDASVQVMQ